jgi:hypothetical protein
VARRVIVLVHDDWEIRGNGTGNVADLQYLPSLFLLRLARELGLRVTFMAEVMQQLAMSHFAAAHRNLRIQTALWEECLAMYAEEGHDVQLHIHPHWHEARFEKGFFRLGHNWNLATYPDAARTEILGSAISYLTTLMRKLDPQYAVHSFKAGSWGLQPSGGLLRDLDRAGVRLVMGPGKAIALKSPYFEADYRAMEEDLLPYYPNFDNVERVSTRAQRIVVLPLPYYRPGFAGNARAVLRRLRSAPRSVAERPYEDAAPADVVGNSPLRPVQGGGLATRVSGLRTLDVSGAPFEEARHAIDQIMRRCLRAAPDVVPLTIQGHSKGFPGRWQEVGRFYRYLVDRYGAVIEFMTMTEFQRAVPNLTIVRSSGSNE